MFSRRLWKFIMVCGWEKKGEGKDYISWLQLVIFGGFSWVICTWFCFPRKPSKVRSFDESECEQRSCQCSSVSIKDHVFQDADYIEFLKISLKWNVYSVFKSIFFKKVKYLGISKCSFKMAETHNRNSSGGVSAEAKGTCWEGGEQTPGAEVVENWGASGSLLRLGASLPLAPSGVFTKDVWGTQNLKKFLLCLWVNRQAVNKVESHRGVL